LENVAVGGKRHLVEKSWGQNEMVALVGKGQLHLLKVRGKKDKYTNLWNSFCFYSNGKSSLRSIVSE